MSPFFGGSSLDAFFLVFCMIFGTQVGHRGMREGADKHVEMHKSCASRNVLEGFVLECVLCGMLDNVCVLYCCVFVGCVCENVLGSLV